MRPISAEKYGIIVICLEAWRMSAWVNTNLLISTEQLINSLAEYDITYPTELDYRGRVTEHVTTLSSHRRRRRSVNEETGPIIYQVLLLQVMKIFHSKWLEVTLVLTELSRDIHAVKRLSKIGRVELWSPRASSLRVPRTSAKLVVSLLLNRQWKLNL